MGLRVSWALIAAFAVTASSQVIDFESGGLKYQSLTRNGITIMCARLPAHLKEYALIQVAITNGTDGYTSIKPEDFTFARSDSAPIAASPASDVVTMMMEHGTHSDLVKLVLTYEHAIYGIPNMKLANGYERRRQAAMAEGVNERFKAAAAASAVALVQTRVGPTQSADGAVFFPASGRGPMLGRVIVHLGGEVWEFNEE